MDGVCSLLHYWFVYFIHVKREKNITLRFHFEFFCNLTFINPFFFYFFFSFGQFTFQDISNKISHMLYKTDSFNFFPIVQDFWVLSIFNTNYCTGNFARKMTKMIKYLRLSENPALYKHSIPWSLAAEQKQN